MSSHERVAAVVSSGWRAGDLILEKAGLDWIDQLPADFDDPMNDPQYENVYAEGDIQHPETDILIAKSEPVSVEQVSVIALHPVDFSSEEQTNFVPSPEAFQGMRSALEQSAWYLKQKPRNHDILELILDAIQSGRLLDVQSQNKDKSEKLVRFIHHNSEGEYSWLTKLSNELDKLGIDPDS